MCDAERCCRHAAGPVAARLTKASFRFTKKAMRAITARLAMPLEKFTQSP
jgi:hypothetical protein